MGQGAAVFAKLMGAHYKRVADPFDSVAAQIAGELLIAKNRKPLF